LDFLSAILLGLVQGLTEFLPISSSAHVQIASELLGFNLSLTKPELTAFIATIQLGTEAAVLIFFWHDIVRIVKAWFASLRSGTAKPVPFDAKLGWLVIIGSIPVVVVGLVFKDAIENGLRSLSVIAWTLIIFGIALGVIDKFAKNAKPITELTTAHGIAFGVGQALAVIPGVSRSGGTISVGLALGYTREAAARYSFLLAIPAVIASGLYEFVTSYSDLNQDQIWAIAVATLAAFVSGYLVIGFLLKYLARGSFLPFVIWRISIGVLLLIGLSAGVLTA
jgi:undecaprenyl-diphosphatase